MTVDGNPIKMPNSYRDYYEKVETRNTSLNGRYQRNRINKKKVAELTWTDLTPDQFQALAIWTEADGAHDFYNPTSRFGVWSFTGLVDVTEEGTYQKGASLMTDTYSVKIREV